MNITLYNSIADPKRVDKLLLLTVARRLTGYLRHGASVINPVVEIELGLNEEIIVDDERVDVNDEDGNKIINFGLNIFRSNYMYIAEFQRYYFITDIESLNNRLWAIHGHVDVLQSYAVELRLHTALIDRNEFSYIGTIQDNRRELNTKTNVYSILSPTEIGYDNLSTKLPIDNPFTKEDKLSEVYRYILTVYNPGNISFPGDMYRRSFTSNCKYVMQGDQVNNLLSQLNSGKPSGTSSTDKTLWFEIKNIYANNPMEAITSLLAYPINLQKKFGIESSDLSSISIGDFSTTAKGAIMNTKIDENFKFDVGNFYFECLTNTGTYLPKLHRKNITPETETEPATYVDIPVAVSNMMGSNWWDYLSEISIFLPYAGFINVYPEDVLGRQLHVKLGIDGETGSGIYFLYTAPGGTALFDEENLTLIKTVNTQIGMPVALSATNHAEKQRNMLQVGASTAAGAVLGGVAGAVLGGAVSALSGKFTTTVQRGTFSGGNWAENYVDLQIAVNIIHKPPIESDEVFKHENGLPLKQERLLALVSGYTEISKIRLNLIPRATKTELDELEELLRVGVIF